MFLGKWPVLDHTSCFKGYQNSQQRRRQRDETNHRKENTYIPIRIQVVFPVLGSFSMISDVPVSSEWDVERKDVFSYRAITGSYTGHVRKIRASSIYAGLQVRRGYRAYQDGSQVGQTLIWVLINRMMDSCPFLSYNLIILKIGENVDISRFIALARSSLISIYNPILHGVY